MKIEQGPFQAISQLEPQYKEKALAGRFYHTKRTFVVKTQDAYLAVTFTIFERLKAAFLKIFGKDYFKNVLEAKSVTFVTNNELAKIVAIPAQVAQVAIPKALPPGVPAQAPVAIPAPAAVPPAAAPAANPGIVQQPLQPAAGTVAQAPVAVASAPPAAPRLRPQLQPAGAPAQAPAAAPAVPAAVPQTGQNLNQADIERIVRRGLPFARTPLADLEALIPKFDDYMKDRKYQETTFRNTSSDVTLIGDRDFNKLALNDLQVFLRSLLVNGRIAAYAPHRSGYGIFEKQEQIVWEKDQLYKPEMVFTKAKLLEMDQHMNQVRFPPPSAEFSDAQRRRFHDITKLIDETQFQRIQHKTSKAGEAWELNQKLLGSKEVMDFLVKANVIYAWNHFSAANNNNLIVKFAQTDVWKDAASAIGQTWRDAAFIQQEEEFQRRSRIAIPANADLSQFKSVEQDRLKKIVELLNKRVAFGQPAGLDRQMVDEKLLKWLEGQRFIVGFEAPNAIAPFRIYVTEEDRKH